VEKRARGNLGNALCAYFYSLSWHVHVHILISCGGLDTTETKWKNNFYIPHEVLKNGFKKHFLGIVQKLWEKEDSKKYIPSQRFLFTKEHQLEVIQKVQRVTWYVDIREKLDNVKAAIKYIGRYTKRPAIAESRIHAYNGSEVTYSYKEHRMTKEEIVTVPVFEFMKRLIIHIPDKNFRIIRYSGFFANRVRSTLLPKVYAILKQDIEEMRLALKKLKTGTWWRDRITRFTQLDPLICSVCLIPLSLINVVYMQQKRSTL
jgi:hypothetical protein